VIASFIRLGDLTKISTPQLMRDLCQKKENNNNNNSSSSNNNTTAERNAIVSDRDVG